MNLNVEAERWKEPAREQLHPLRLFQGTGAGKKRLEAILILRDSARATAIRQFEEGSSAERGAVAQVEQFLEPAPRWRTLVRLDLDVPHLRPVLQIVGGHPDLLLRDALLMKIILTTIDKRQWIGLAVVFGKIHLLETRWAIVMAFG